MPTNDPHSKRFADDRRVSKRQVRQNYSNNFRFEKIIPGRKTLDLKEEQVIEFESEIKTAFLDPNDEMVNVLFRSGRQIKVDSSGTVHSLSNFKEIQNVFLDRWAFL